MARKYHISILVFIVLLFTVSICHAKESDSKGKTVYRIGIKDLKLSEQEAIQAAKDYLLKNEYNRYYVISKPRRLEENSNNWIIYFPQKGKSSDITFDLRAIVNITSVKVEIEKTHLSRISSRHHDESLIGADVVAECSVFGVSNSISGCILYLGGLGANRLEAVIPKDALQGFFDKCGFFIGSNLRTGFIKRNQTKA